MLERNNTFTECLIHTYTTYIHTHRHMRRLILVAQAGNQEPMHFFGWGRKESGFGNVRTLPTRH